MNALAIAHVSGCMAGEEMAPEGARELPPGLLEDAFERLIDYLVARGAKPEEAAEIAARVQIIMFTPREATA